MTAINCFTEGRSSRPSTQYQTAESAKNSFPANRGILPPDITASVDSVENHDCSQVNVENSIVKVTARLFFSQFRFYVAHVWECSTIRGPTLYNGAQSHCGGKCQAAHAALAPTLYDDKLERVIQLVKDVGYRELSKTDQTYLKNRFVLDKAQEKLLSHKDESKRFEHMMWIVSRLKTMERKGSFINTSIGFARNATFANPAASNRVDCYLERSLQPLEKELSEECRTSTKLPKEALNELFLKHRELLVNLQNRLPVGESNLLAFQTAWENLVTSQAQFVEILTASDLYPQKTDEETVAFTPSLLKSLADDPKIKASFEAYMKSVEEYRKMTAERSSHPGEGVPKLENLQKNQLDNLQSPYILKHLSNFYEKNGIQRALSYFITKEMSLKIPSVEDTQKIEESFKEGIDEINRRAIETKAQLSIFEKDFKEIHELMNMTWGHKNENGFFCTPTKERILQCLNDQLGRVTPTRLRKRKPDVFSSPYQTPTKNKTPKRLKFSSPLFPEEDVTTPKQLEELEFEQEGSPESFV
ncbi:MAG: hypothetical protein Q8L98_06170 [Chlamydiales bacterium]|nr:hypothetical protein [Chlamydiales bacterium]